MQIRHQNHPLGLESGGGIEQDESNMQEAQEEYPLRRSRLQSWSYHVLFDTARFWIWMLLSMYAFLVVLLFTYPRYAAKPHHGDGPAAIVESARLVFQISRVTTTLNVVSLILAWRKWDQLNQLLRIAVVLQFLSWVLLWIVVTILADTGKHALDP